MYCIEFDQFKKDMDNHVQHNGVINMYFAKNIIIKINDKIIYDYRTKKENSMDNIKQEINEKECEVNIFFGKNIKNEDETISEIKKENIMDNIKQEINEKECEVNICFGKNFIKEDETISVTKKENSIDNIKQEINEEECELNMFFGKNIKKENETISEVDVQGITVKGELNTDDVLNNGIHVDISSSNHGFLCDLCKLSFQLKSVLISHMKLNHADIYLVKKQFQCPDGNTKFDLSNYAGNRYACIVCLKTFTKKRNLSIHEKVHTEEKPYACHVCQTNFSRKRYLSRHAKVHSGEKPYECHVCQKRFSQKYNLSIHTRIHTGEKPYTCRVCQKNFNQIQHLSRHAKRHF